MRKYGLVCAGEEHNTWEPKDHLAHYACWVEQVDTEANVEEHQTMREKVGKRARERALQKTPAMSAEDQEKVAQDAVRKYVCLLLHM